MLRVVHYPPKKRTINAWTHLRNCFFHSRLLRSEKILFSIFFFWFCGCWARYCEIYGVGPNVSKQFTIIVTFSIDQMEQTRTRKKIVTTNEIGIRSNCKFVIRAECGFGLVILNCAKTRNYLFGRSIMRWSVKFNSRRRLISTIRKCIEILWTCTL